MREEVGCCGRSEKIVRVDCALLGLGIDLRSEDVLIFYTSSLDILGQGYEIKL